MSAAVHTVPAPLFSPLATVAPPALALLAAKVEAGHGSAAAPVVVPVVDRAAVAGGRVVRKSGGGHGQATDNGPGAAVAVVDGTASVRAPLPVKWSR